MVLVAGLMGLGIIGSVIGACYVPPLDRAPRLLTEGRIYPIRGRGKIIIICVLDATKAEHSKSNYEIYN